MMNASDVAKMMKMGWTKEEIIRFAAAQEPAPTKGKTAKAKATTDKVVFMKYNKETGARDIPVECTQAQKDAWEKHSANYHAFDKEAWEQKRTAYKPSKQLIAAIKKDRASVTHKVAKSLGFVGTKQDLAALKAQVLSK